MPAGQLWEAYRTVLAINATMQRQLVLPPGAPEAAVAALRAAVSALNDDKEHADEALKTIGYVPEWVTGTDVNAKVREAITVAPDMRAFLADYIRRAAK
jgi:tripartite-type tricarboxylate transporter receptor subunit TctC